MNKAQGEWPWLDGNWTAEYDDYGDEVWFKGEGYGIWKIVGFPTPESDDSNVWLTGENVIAYLGGKGFEDGGAKRMRSAALLIAAAPELLAALELAVELGFVPVSSASDGGASRYSSQVAAADQIRAAIAKAKGETE